MWRVLVLCAVPGVGLAQAGDWPGGNIGAVPSGWEIAGDGDDAADWRVVEVEGARALKMAGPSDAALFGLAGSGFNVITDPDVAFRDGEISVRFRAVSGNVDQGGGIMWRVVDAENYYLARYNPLEDNFRSYVVIDGSRHPLASVAVTLDGGWHEMVVEQVGPLFRGSLDGAVVLEHSDGRLSEAGAAGLWTKADAVTLFDDFVMRVRD
jgi:hypothetical protein